jgi:hypothetical protein
LYSAQERLARHVRRGLLVYVATLLLLLLLLLLTCVEVHHINM